MGEGGARGGGDAHAQRRAFLRFGRSPAWLAHRAPAPPPRPTPPHQGWAEKLFARLQGGRERFEARVALMSVLSRTIGVHQLLVLNFYPFLQARGGGVCSAGERGGCVGRGGWGGGRLVVQ